MFRKQSSILRDFNNNKGKGHLITEHEGPEMVYGYSFTPSLTAAIHVIGGKLHAPANLPQESTRYQLYRSLDVFQGWSENVRKISPPTAIRSPDRPARSEYLYRLSCRGPFNNNKGLIELPEDITLVPNT